MGLWEYRGGTDDGPVQHVDLVLLDEKVHYDNCYSYSSMLLTAGSARSHLLPVMFTTGQQHLW